MIYKQSPWKHHTLQVRGLWEREGLNFFLPLAGFLQREKKDWEREREREILRERQKYWEKEKESERKRKKDGQKNSCEFLSISNG